MAGREQAARDAIQAFLLGVERSQAIAQLGAGHAALKFGPQQHGGEEFVLIEQHVLVERHVGDANGVLVAQRAVVAPDGNFEHRTVAMRVQAAMAVVIADRIGGGEIGDPAGFEQRDQPGLMLAADGDRTGDGERERAACSDGAIENRIDAAKKGAAERGKAVSEQLIESFALVDAADADLGAIVLECRHRRFDLTQIAGGNFPTGA